MRRLIFFFSVFSFISWSGWCQESKYKVNFDWDHERHVWSAWWITHPTASVYDYGVFNYRLKFELGSVPDPFLIYVSADNRYRLFVNGKPVSFGPARGSLEFWRYETVNISKYLKAGTNLISAEVFNLGSHRPVAQFSHQTAFILQSEKDGDVINTGSGNWKVVQNKAYRPIEVTREMVMGKYYVAGPCDSITLSKYPWGWKSDDYDDSHWLKPKTTQRGTGRGYMHGSPWWLIPRNIPPMEQKIIRFKTARRFYPENLNINDRFVSGNHPILIPAHSIVSILLDNEKLNVGYPLMTVSGGKGSTIKVTYAEALYDKTGHKGNRNEIENKKIAGYFDIFLPDGSANRAIRPLWLRTYRYVQLDVITGEDPLTLQDFYGVFTAYPFRQNASFESDSPGLKNIWDVAWHTARCCAGETYMDCPYWEQLQYIGDTRIQALISLYVSGDDRLMRNALQLMDHSRIPEGLTLGRCPSYIPQITPPFSLYWADMVHDYFMLRRDDAFIKTFLPGIEAVLGWFERRLDDTGMLGPLDWFNFSDWATGFMCGAPAGVDPGHSALISLNYAYALDRAAQLFRYFGKKDRSAHYNALSKSIKKAVYAFCFNHGKGLLADTPEQNTFSQHTNIFGILTNTFPLEDQEKIMKKILSDTSLIQTTIYYKFYLFRALKHAKLANMYLTQLGPWHEMIAKGLSTFEEGDYDERSDCHAWGSSPMYDFLATVCGITPAAPCFKKVVIEPAMGPLKTVRATMPHPDGQIVLDLQLHGKKLSVHAILPGNLDGSFLWKGKKIALHEGVNDFTLTQ